MNAVEPRHGSGSDDLSGSPEEREVTRVLVVDDDHAIRDTLRLLLEDAGYAVTEAGNGVDALAVLCDERASYITLLDLRMPQLDGAGVLGVVAEDPDLARRHSFILMTADARALSPLFISHLARLAVPLLPKPFDIDDLFDLVERAECELTARQPLAHRAVPGNRAERQSA